MSSSYISKIRKPMPGKKAVALLGTVLALLLGGSMWWFFWFGDSKRQATTETTLAQPPIAVRTAVAKTLPVLGDRTLTGTVEAVESVTLTSRVMGRILQLSIEEGDYVERGQTIASIDVKDIRAGSDRAAAAIPQAQAAVTVAELAYITAQSQKNQAEARLDETQARRYEVQARRDEARAREDEVRAREDEARASLDETEARRGEAEAKLIETEAHLVEARAELAEAKLDRERMAMLLTDGAVSQSRLDEANTRVAVIEARIGQIQSQMEQTRAAIAAAQARMGQARAAIAAAQARMEQARAAVSQAEAQMQQIEAQIPQAQEQIQQAETLALQAEARANQARAGVEQAVAGVEESAANLEYGTAIAPFNGVVTRKHAEVGAMAGPGQPLATIESTDRLRFSVPVPESLIARLRIGQVVEVQLDALERSAGGRVSQIIPAISPTSRNFTVKIDLDREPNMIPGMFGRLQVPTNDRTALMIPVDALVERLGISGAYKVVDGEVQFMPIAVGAVRRREVEVFSGLADGDRVILNPSSDLANGTLVSFQ